MTSTPVAVFQRAYLWWSAFGVVAVVSSLLVLARPANDRLSDLHIYYGAMRHLQEGLPLYEFAAENGGPFTYPPFAALVFWPITVVPEPVLRVVWLAAVCAAVATLAWAVAKALPAARRYPGAVVAAIACGILVSAPAQSNLRFGQISIFIVLLALVDAMGLTPARYRGVLVGVAAAIKLTPLLFVVFFLGARRPRDAARATASFLGCAAVAAVVLPTESWTYWTTKMLATDRIGNLASLGNQSLHGMLLRIGFDGPDLRLLWAALIAVICGVALLRARALQAHDEPVRAAVLVGCATVVASPVSWTHHQIWPVLAAMLLVGAAGTLRRVAGAGLLVVMTLSLGALLADLTPTPGAQFVLENARTVAVIGVCCAGFGGAAFAATRLGSGAGAGRRALRAGTTLGAALAIVALLPLPAGADPTFKAYSAADTDNPRYFYYCRTPQPRCADLVATAGVVLDVRREPTKTRVNGLVDDTIGRMEYMSAPGGTRRPVPLVEVYPGQRAFSFRSANIAEGRILVYGWDGAPITAYDHRLRNLSSQTVARSAGITRSP